MITKLFISGWTVSLKLSEASYSPHHDDFGHLLPKWCPVNLTPYSLSHFYQSGHGEVTVQSVDCQAVKGEELLGVVPIGSGWRVSRVVVLRLCSHHGEVENSSGSWWGNVSRGSSSNSRAPQAQPLNSWGKQIAHAQSYFRASGGQLSSSVIQND